MACESAGVGRDTRLKSRPSHRVDGDESQVTSSSSPIADLPMSDWSL